MARERSAAFAPGRVNLIGEHTDYNQGLALPFAIAAGVTVHAVAPTPTSRGQGRIETHAQDVDERDDFALPDPSRAPGWRGFVRGVAVELLRAGIPLRGASLTIHGDVPAGAGLSSSAALEVALCLALIGLDGDSPQPPRRPLDTIELAQLCARVENEWVGAHTGLLDQLASLCGAPDTALCIDFRTLLIEPVPLALGEWRLATIDSGERHVHAGSGYNERRTECARACGLLGIESLRDASLDAARGLPEPLRRRALHVIEENQRVRDGVEALREDDLPRVAALLNASHASLRDLYEVGTPAVEAAVQRMHDAGAMGARMIGGGFGGSVLGLFAPGVRLPQGAREVRPSPGARRLAD